MNLYYALTNYHLLCCILHVLKYHKNENNVLYLSKWHPDCREILKNLEIVKIFNRVEIFDEVDSPSGNQKVSDNQLSHDIDEIVSKIPENFIMDVNASKEINIVGDHYCCSVYLVKKKIYYNYFEDACGILSDEERLYRYLKNNDYSRYQIVKKLKLLGNHSYILKRYGNLHQQLEGYYNEKDVDFSVPDILKTISSKDINRIVLLFSNEKITIPNNSVLFLTFHYVSMQLLNLEEQKLLYILLVDYFTGDRKLVIKPHPSDIQPNYEEWFPNSVILPRKMPSELLPILHSKKFSRALTAYSTSVTVLKDYCNDVISFSANIEKSFYSINKYYFILQILKDYSIEDYEIFGLGLDASIIKNILYEYDINNFNIQFVVDLYKRKNEKKRIIIIDDFEISDLKNFFVDQILEEDIVIFLNFNKLVNFILSDVLKIYPNCFFSIFLRKNQTGEIHAGNKWLLKDEIMEVYCCDKKFLSYVSSQKVSKNLKYSHISIVMETNIVTKLNQLYEEIDSFAIKEKNCYQKIKELNDTCASLEFNLQTIQDKNREYIKKINEVQEDVERYKFLYNEVLASSSWKITKIYRKIGGFLKKIMKKEEFHE